MKDADRKELVKYRITRAHETLQEISILIENKLWRGRCYSADRTGKTIY